MRGLKSIGPSEDQAYAFSQKDPPFQAAANMPERSSRWVYWLVLQRVGRTNRATIPLKLSVCFESSSQLLIVRMMRLLDPYR